MKKVFKNLMLITLLLTAILSTGCSQIQGILDEDKTWEFTDEDNKISITAPKRYKEEKVDNDYAISIYDEKNDRYVSVTIEYKVDFYDDITFDEYVDMLLEFWEEYNTNILEEKDITVDGHTAVSLLNEYQKDGYKYKSLTYVVEGEDAFYIVDTISSVSGFTKAEEEYRQILDSIDIK